MTKTKSIIFCLAIVSMIFSFNMVSKTYAKYVTNSNSATSLNIARWDIVVNDEHIKNGDNLDAEITPTYVDNPNVAAGVIAPGSIGYFDMTIDAGSTDVSFKYEISVAASESSNVSDLRLLRYYIDDENNMVDVTEDASIIENSIMISDENHEQHVRIYIIWDDFGKMDNEQDSIVGHDAENMNAKLDVKLKFSQLI